MLKEDINNTISDSVKKEIAKIIKYPLRTIIIGGNFGISSNFNPTSLDNSYFGNELCFVFESEKSTFSLSISVIEIGRDISGCWDFITGKIREHKKSSKEIFEVEKQLLINNRGLLYLTMPHDLQIQNIEIFGTQIKDHIARDEDFPEEDTLVNINIDSVLKIITNQSYLLSVQPNSGKLRVNFHSELNNFQKIISASEHWGEYKRLSYRYSI